jgi:hypothetical protein
MQMVSVNADAEALAALIQYFNFGFPKYFKKCFTLKINHYHSLIIVLTLYFVGLYPSLNQMVSVDADAKVLVALVYHFN